MAKLIHGFYNMDSNAVELIYNDGSVLTIDCEEAENFYDVTNGQMVDLDWLLYNKPLEYASLVLSGEMEDYLKGPALHGIEEETVCRCIEFSGTSACLYQYLPWISLHNKCKSRHYCINPVYTTHALSQAIQLHTPRQDNYLPVMGVFVKMRNTARC